MPTKKPRDYKLDESESIEKHINEAGVQYLRAINDTRPESMVDMTERLSPLLQYLHDGHTAISIGIGQGEEVCALHELFGNRINIIGVDVSSNAINETRLRLMRNQFPINLFRADATKLPFRDGTADAIILSSTLHEIYSYHQNGTDAFRKCLSENTRVLRKGGVIFIRDFAAPDTDERVSLHIRTPIAMKFYESFRTSFRKFAQWDTSMKKNKLAEDFFPPLGHGTVFLPLSKAAEFLLHFRSFWSDYQSGSSYVGNPSWKETDEMYLIRKGHTVLSPDQYINTISRTLGKRFTLVYRKLRNRTKTNLFLSKHVSLSVNGTKDLVSQTTRKLECIFQKDTVIQKHYSASVVFDEKGYVLLCKRSPHKKVAPNVWHLPGGTIEFDESAPETVVRELKEELDLNATTVIPTHARINYIIKGTPHQTHIFLVEVSNKPKLMNQENSEFKFVPTNKILHYLEPHIVADNLHAIRIAAAIRKNKGI